MLRGKKKRFIRLSKPHSLMWFLTLFLLSTSPGNHKAMWMCVCVCVCVQGASDVISQCVCVCDKISPVNTLVQMTRPHTLLSRTHYLSHTHTHTVQPSLGSAPPPSLIRVFVDVSDVLFILDLQCVCRAVERELILCWWLLMRQSPCVQEEAWIHSLR